MSTYRLFLHIFDVLLICDGMFSAPSPSSAERISIEISSTSDSNITVNKEESATVGDVTELPYDHDGPNKSHKDPGISVIKSDTKSTKVTPSTARPKSSMYNAKQNPPPEMKNDIIQLFSLLFFILIVLLLGILYFLNMTLTERMNSSLYSRPHTKNRTEIRIDYDVNSLHRALIELKKTQDTLKERLNQTELKSVQKFAVDLTLDPDTAHPHLILSDDGKQVSAGGIQCNATENPKRFEAVCVLAKQGFSSGRFYYEVQVKGKTRWTLGVARESINRKGRIRLSPRNGVWTVILRNKNEYKACDDPSFFLPLRVKPEKVGVFVDYEEGLVSFYDVDSRSHLYSITGQTFTEKLYPYFSPDLNDEGKNSNPLIITPFR